MTTRPTPLPNHTRVRHAGEKYLEAGRDGTATIVGHFWMGSHLEYRVLHDGVRRDREPEERQWAFYHTRRIDSEL